MTGYYYLFHGNPIPPQTRIKLQVTFHNNNRVQSTYLYNATLLVSPRSHLLTCNEDDSC